MSSSCDQCGGPIDQLRPGRVARFCSDNCRVAFHRAVVPELMRKEHRWATWEAPSKMPRQVGGAPASVTDPSTWASYPQVRGRRGKGYMLGNNIGCVEFDQVIDPDTDVLHPVIDAMLAPLMTKTYIEISPSGTGLHVFGVMNEDRGWRRQLPDGMSVELYSRERFVTVTGSRVSKTSKLHPMRQHFAQIEGHAPAMATS